MMILKLATFTASNIRKGSPTEWGMRIFNPYNPPPIRPERMAATSSHNDAWLLDEILDRIELLLFILWLMLLTTQKMPSPHRHRRRWKWNENEWIEARGERFGGKSQRGGERYGGKERSFDFPPKMLAKDLAGSSPRRHIMHPACCFVRQHHSSQIRSQIQIQSISFVCFTLSTVSLTTMAITTAQQEILTRVRANYTSGLSSAEVSQRRSISSGDGGGTRGGLNTVRPPLNCPKWVCCLLWVVLCCRLIGTCNFFQWS